MVLRTARQGRNVGSQFWGCRGFPQCRGARDAGDVADDRGPSALQTFQRVFDARDADDRGLAGKKRPKQANSSRKHSLASLPVAWHEGASRSEYVPQYVSVGALPGVFREDLKDNKHLERALSQCVLLSSRNRSRESASDHARLVSTLLAKVLQRGHTPLPTLEIERVALEVHGLADKVYDLSADRVEMGWDLYPEARQRIEPEAVLKGIVRRDPFSLDSTFSKDRRSHAALLQSDEEARFFEHWVPEELGPTAGHWFTPQAPLDLLLESGGERSQGYRRVDFLFHHPGGKSLVIEIDGPEHANAARVDEVRDRSLRRIGIEVIRIKNDEIRQGNGQGLRKVRQHYEQARSLRARKYWQLLFPT